MATKLVVLGIPWDVNTEGLKDYMSKFGELDDVIVMKERSTGRSRGFGYVTFASADDAQNALESEHVLGGRTLEVKVATPREETRNQSSKKVTRIFVARIPHSVTVSDFKSYFEKFGEITDLYMPKETGSKGHRGIGFITFENSDSVDSLMSETHVLGGSTIVVDRATPKDEETKHLGKATQGGYGAYNAYMSTRYASFGASNLYDHPGAGYGRFPEPMRGMGKKIFVGRLPQEAGAEDLRQYFSRFGHLSDVYVPKDPKRSGHRGFGFVTFTEDGVADRVARRTHEILGHEVAIDSATPLDGPAGESGSFLGPVDHSYGYGAFGAYGGYGGTGAYGGGAYGGPMRSYNRLYGSLDFDDWGYGPSSGGPAGRSRPDWRYRPY